MWTLETGGKPEGACGHWRWGRTPRSCQQVGEMCAVTSEDGVTTAWGRHGLMWVGHLGWAPASQGSDPQQLLPLWPSPPLSEEGLRPLPGQGWGFKSRVFYCLCHPLHLLPVP